MHRILTLALLAAVALAAAPATAIPLTEWGAAAQASTADCPSFCTNFDFDGNVFTSPGATSASASIDDSKGRAEAYAQLQAGFTTPELRVFARSDLSFQGSGFGTAFAVEGYTNDSGGTETFTFDITLTASVVDSTPLDNDTSVTAEIVLYEVDDFFFTTSRGTLEFEAGAVPIDETLLTINTTTATSVTGSVSVTLDPGDQVYLWAFMRAEAERDLSQANGLNTLGFEIDTPGLTPASVPEPGMAWLLGAAGLAAVRRGRRG